MATPEEILNEAADALRAVQEFDVNTLPREDILGAAYSFKSVVEPASELVDLFRRLPLSVLEDLPPNTLKNIIQGHAAQVIELFNQVLQFDNTKPDAHTKRSQLIAQFDNQYQVRFDALHPYISYSLHKTADFQRLTKEARDAVDDIKEKSDEILGNLNNAEEEAAQVLKEIRQVASEQGVTQQAIYFKTTADDHVIQSGKWLVATILLSILLGIYAIGSLFLHKIPYLDYEGAYNAVQITVSKILIFAVITFMLYLSARNYLSHRHNAVVNRHRQNALVTYKALIEAAEKPTADAVLLHAAACIYAPQPTGYGSSTVAESQNAQSVIELLSKPVTGSTE